MSVTVTFKIDEITHTVTIPEGHSVLETSVPLSMAAEDSPGTFAVSPEWNISIEHFNLYLRANTEIRWRTMKIEDIVLSMRVAVKLNDEFTIDQCINELHRIMNGWGVRNDELKHQALYTLLSTIVTHCENPESVVLDVLSQMPVSFIVWMGGSVNHFNTAGFWVTSGLTPKFGKNGNLFGLNYYTILRGSLRNVVTKKTMGAVDVLIAKYYNTTDDITFEDACAWMEHSGDVLSLQDIFLGSKRTLWCTDEGKCYRNILRICPTFIGRQYPSNIILLKVHSIPNNSIARLALTKSVIGNLTELGDLLTIMGNNFGGGTMMHQFSDFLGELYPSILQRLGPIMGPNHFFVFNEDMERISLWKAAILEENREYFISRDQHGIAEKFYT